MKYKKTMIQNQMPKKKLLAALRKGSKILVRWAVPDRNGQWVEVKRRELMEQIEREYDDDTHFNCAVRPRDTYGFDVYLR